MSETARYRQFTVPYCMVPNPDPNRFPPPHFGERVPGCGVDLASGGDPVVPWAWQLELPPDQYAYYNSNCPVRGPIQLRGDATTHCASEGNCLDFVYCSHLLEDLEEARWDAVLSMWSSMLKPGGYLIILTPEHYLWNAAIRRGQPPNCSHTHEPLLGEVGKHGKAVGLEIVEDRLTALTPEDYTILTVLRKP